MTTTTNRKPLSVEYDLKAGYLYFDLNGKLIGVPFSASRAAGAADEGMDRIRDALTEMEVEPVSDERVEFLTDVLGMALDGPMSSWYEGDSYDYDNTDPSKRGFTVRFVTEVDDAVPELPARVTLDMLDKAFQKFRMDVKNDFCRQDYRAEIMRADELNDASDMDNVSADLVFQVALMGVTVYG